ncbi:MAG TPA: homoserine kinase [Bacillota bacterium]
MRIEAKVPASVANLGPGFDCIGMAVDRFQLRLSLVPGGEERSIEVRGVDADRIERGPDNLVCRALDEAFRFAGCEPPRGFRLMIDNDIPLARGLGSSAAAIVGGLLLAREWLLAGDVLLSLEDIADLAVSLEGHGDNVIAALVGGVAVSVKGADGVRWQATRTTEFPALVLAVPESWQKTADARRLLPASVPYEDAVYNSAHTALLIAALMNGDYAMLREAMRDRLHEPYRERIYPWLPNVRRAALEAGAFGVSLSGAGPSTAAFVPAGNISSVMQAMASAYREAGLRAEVYRAAVAGGALARTVPAGDGVSWPHAEPLEVSRGLSGGAP